MKKLIIILNLLTTSYTAFAKTNLESKQQGKLAIYSCTLKPIEQVKLAFGNNLEKAFQNSECVQVSDILRGAVMDQLKYMDDRDYLTSLESVETKQTDGHRWFWEKCDGEDTKCIGNSTGFSGHVINYFLLTSQQKAEIVKATSVGPENRTIRLFYLANEVKVDKRSIESILTTYDLTEARLQIK